MHFRGFGLAKKSNMVNQCCRLLAHYDVFPKRCFFFCFFWSREWVRAAHADQNFNRSFLEVMKRVSNTRGIHILSISSKSDNNVENIVVVFPPISSIFLQSGVITDDDLFSDNSNLHGIKPYEAKSTEEPDFSLM